MTGLDAAPSLIARAAAWCGEPLHHGSLSPEGYREALATAGFTVLAAEPHPAKIGPGLVWLARLNDPAPA